MQLHLDQLHVYQIILRVIQVPVHIHVDFIVFKVTVYIKSLKLFLFLLSFSVYLSYKSMWKFKMQTQFYAPF